MTRFFAATFVLCLNKLYMALAACGMPEEYSEKAARDLCQKAISDLSTALSEAGLPRLEAEAQRLCARVNNCTSVQLIALLYAFRDNLVSELTGHLFIRLELGAKPFYLISQFGQSSIEAFPEAGRDMTAASRCFALEEWDATVFHCMRVLESGLTRLADRFGVTSKQQNWQNLINGVQGRIRSICEETHGIEWKAEEQFYSNAASHLYFVKAAWRNYVMHGNDHYDHKESIQVFDATRNFMSQLAPRFS